MKIQTQYSYEKNWTDTSEKDLLRIIEEEIGDADSKGTLTYVKETIKNGKVSGNSFEFDGSIKTGFGKIEYSATGMVNGDILDATAKTKFGVMKISGIRV